MPTRQKNFNFFLLSVLSKNHIDININLHFLCMKLAWRLVKATASLNTNLLTFLFHNRSFIKKKKKTCSSNFVKSFISLKRNFFQVLLEICSSQIWKLYNICCASVIVMCLLHNWCTLPLRRYSASNQPKKVFLNSIHSLSRQ